MNDSSGRSWLRRPRPFFFDHGQFIVLQSAARLPRQELARRLRKATGVEPRVLPGGPEICRRIGVVTSLVELLLEDGDTLHLLAGTPRGWLSNGKTIEVRRAPTAFGDAGLRLESLASRNALLCTIDPPARKAARVLLHLRPPSRFGAPKRVTVNNKAWTWASAETLDLGSRLRPQQFK